MMLIPQPLSHAPADNVKIEVIYSRSSGGTETTHTSVVDLATGFNGDYFLDSSLNPITEWETGKRYTYKLNLGLHKVFIDPDVQAWTAGGGGDINI